MFYQLHITKEFPSKSGTLYVMLCACLQTTKRPQTAGTLFKNSMIALVKTLTSKEPFYVRCIKPNEDKSPTTMNEERVAHQVRYLGLLENVRVRRAGFAHRQRYDRFLKR